MIGRTSMGIVRLCGAFTIRSDLAAAPGHCGAGCGPVGRGEGLPVSAECLTASRWQPRRAAGVPLPSSVHQMEPAGPDLVHSVSSQDPSPRQNPYAPPRGTRAGAGTDGCSTGLLPRPRSCQSWSDSFRFQTSQFRVAPTDALIQNPPSTRGRSLAGRHHGSDDVRIQDQRPSARSARWTAAWAS
jgi:hypothetical protein